jgi:IS5 family transposase
LFPNVDKKGIPLKIHVTKGNKHDAKIAPKVITILPINETKENNYILADKAYDSKKIREIIKIKKYKPIIAKRKYKSKKIRSLKKKYIKLYRKRIIVENFFSWIKAYPKIDKIYEKSMASYKGLLYLAISILIYKRL